MKGAALQDQQVARQDVLAEHVQYMKTQWEGEVEADIKKKLMLVQKPCNRFAGAVMQCPALLHSMKGAALHDQQVAR